MNTNPDEATLALWLDDELTGEALARVESWAQTQPEQMEAREAVRKWRGMMASALPASEEPPFPDFFNSRVRQAIVDATAQSAPEQRVGWSWKSWFMPTAACAGMVMTFWAGTRVNPPVTDEYAAIPRAIIVEPALYTPENGVEAEWVSSQNANASVIILKGVAAIPDSFDLTETAYEPLESEVDSTAYNDQHHQREVGF
jgi:hypothetical protein